MYLIGFFTSPLPYLILAGIYMSGFAYFNWATGHVSGVADDQNMVELQQPAGTSCAVDVTQTIFPFHGEKKSGTTVSPNDAGPALQDHVQTCFHTVGFNLPSRQIPVKLTLLTHRHLIRPPPVA